MPVITNRTVNFDIEGIEEIQEALSKGYLRISNTAYEWIKDERDRLVGSKRGRSKKIRKGIRELIATKRRKGRSGVWGKGIAAQWKGKVFGNKDKIGSLRYEAGLFKSKSGFKQGLINMHTGKTQSTKNFMVIPIYKNLRKIGFTGPFFKGFFSSGLKSKALQKLLSGLYIKIKGNKIYYYNKSAFNKKTGRFKKSDLLFIGTKNILVKRILTGKYDIRERFKNIVPKSLERGKKAISKTITKINR